MLFKALLVGLISMGLAIGWFGPVAIMAFMGWAQNHALERADAKMGEAMSMVGMDLPAHIPQNAPAAERLRGRMESIAKKMNGDREVEHQAPPQEAPPQEVPPLE